MGFTYKSSNVQAPDLYDPIDDNILLQGQKAIYDRTMAFAEEANKYKSAFFGQNAYGKDAEILKQKEAEYNAAISEVTKGGIESMEAQTAINAIINQASSDKDILGISQRTSAYERELKNKQEAEAKGREYYSAPLRKAANYYNSGKYYADERFMGSGSVAPEVHKIQSEFIKNNKDVIMRKQMVQGTDGRNYTYNKIDGEKAASLWRNTIESDPSLKSYYEDMFNQQYADADWSVEGQRLLAQAAQNSYELAQNATDPETQQYYLNKYEEQQKLATGKYTGEQMKRITFDNFIKEDANEFGGAYNALDLVEIQEDAFKLDKAKTANSLYEYGEKLKMDAGLYQNKGIPGKPVGDKKITIDGQPVSVSYYSDVINSAFSDTPTASSNDQLKAWVAIAHNKSNPSKPVDATELTVVKEKGELAVYKNKYKIEAGKRVPDGKEKIRNFSKSDLITNLTPGAQKDIEEYETSANVGVGAKYNNTAQ